MRDNERIAYLDIDGNEFTSAKGYTCPEFSQCMTVDNPNNGTISFDNIFQSLELVFVVMSVNTFSDLMYKIIDAEYMVASLFFIVGTLALGLWLANLFIAVIVSSFQTTREEMGVDSEKADAADKISDLFSGKNVHVKHVCRNSIGKMYHYLREIPILVIVTDLLVQCTISLKSSDDKLQFVLYFEYLVTGVLLFEICVRFLIYLPKIRLFFSSVMNCLDVIMAIGSSVILIPAIEKHPMLYAWLSFFQIARFYRVIVAIGFVRNLWARVLSNFRPILNITVFYYLITYLAAILSCQLLRGVIPLETNGEQNFFAFQHLANAFLAMYTISSTENWTTPLYLGVQSANTLFSRICIASFFIAWFILSNYVVLNMFVAIITENLEISPEGKRKEQIKAFVIDIINERNDHSYFQDTRKLLASKLNVKKKRGEYNGPQQTALELIQQDKMDNFLLGEDDNRETAEAEEMNYEKNSRSLLKTLIAVPSHYFASYMARRLASQRENPFHDANEIREYDGEHHTSSDAIVSHMLEAKAQLESLRREYLEQYPEYNKSLRIFRTGNPIRTFCQKIVASSYGVRIEGPTPKPLVWYLFSSFMLLATIALVVIAMISTPIYYKSLVEQHHDGLNWIILTDMVFVAIFTLEAIIKIIADGLYFTPNAYLRSVWGIIDSAVLISLWINFAQELSSRSTVARLIRAFKALRALRLLSFSSQAQELFHIVIIVGIRKIFAAVIVAFGLLFPFSVWGLKLFRGRLLSCNNGDLSGNISACFGEYINTPFNWNVSSPQSVVNTYFDFDNFGGSLLVLFSIISLEGWVDVLQAVMNITNYFEQPEYYGSAFNGVFVMLYNLVGTVFILTLFVSVIIQNYSVMRGSAYLTEDQKTWYEIEKSLKMVRPSKRPPNILPGSLRHRLLTEVVQPNSWFNIMATGCLGILAIILIAEYYPRSNGVTILREWCYLVFTLIYLVFILVRVYTLGPQKFFRRAWDDYALLVTASSLILDIMAVAGNNGTTFYNFQKLFLVGMISLLMPRSRRLDQLLKTCATSASAIGNMLVVWGILFLAYGIAFNQVFGLTRVGPNGSSKINFRTLPRSLVLLFRMSLGEGWNQVMVDYFVEYPECYVAPDGGYSDCGSDTYAYVLFISWNIISMYIFANMFVSLIYENFSYVSRKPDNNINRDEIRKFKNVWFKYDPNSTGYIPRGKLYELLRDLDGYFSLKIHEEPWKVKSILKSSRATTDDRYQVDVHALNKELRSYPAKKFSERRRQLEKFCQHAFILADPDRGIQFNSLLIQFPFYKDMKYSECLKLHDYIRYRDIERKIMSRVAQENSTSAILMAQAVARRRFQLGKKRAAESPFTDPMPSSIPRIPSIEVDDVDNNGHEMW